jgi:hypothetical protein
VAKWHHRVDAVSVCMSGSICLPAWLPPSVHLPAPAPARRFACLPVAQGLASAASMGSMDLEALSCGIGSARSPLGPGLAAGSEADPLATVSLASQASFSSAHVESGALPGGPSDGPREPRRRKWASLRHVNGVAVYQEDEDPDGEGGALMVSAIVRSTPKAAFKVLLCRPSVCLSVCLSMCSSRPPSL